MSDDRQSTSLPVASQLSLDRHPAALGCTSVPFELVLLVPDVVGLVVREELGDAIGQVAVDAVHVAGRGHDGADVLVAVVDALLHLQQGRHVTACCSHCHRTASR